MDDDVAIIGAGAAGLSAALVLGRARRRVVLFDAGEQSNRPAHGIGGLLGHDGLAPGELYARGRQELAQYPTVQVLDERVEAVGGAIDAFDVAGHAARRVLLATGMAYVPPDLPGVRELFGGAVFHCPFCHGWEVRDAPLAVLGSTAVSAFQAVLLRGWSRDVVLVSDGPADLDEATRDQLRDRGIPVVERPLAGLAHRDGRLLAIVFADGDELARDGLLVQAPMRRRDDLAEQLGCAASGHGGVEADVDGRTSVPGVWAAGDLAGTMPQVSAAVAAGARAGAMLAHEHITAGMPSPAAPGAAPAAPAARAPATAP